MSHDAFASHGMFAAPLFMVGETEIKRDLNLRGHQENEKSSYRMEQSILQVICPTRV